MSAAPADREQIDPADLIDHYVQPMNTPVRTARIGKLWDEAKEKAAAEVPPRTMTDLLKALLAEYVAQD